MMRPVAEAGATGPAPDERRGRGRVPLLVLLALLTVVFAGLGIWQVERRAWKLDLIARVDQRVHAGPVPAPRLAEWPVSNANNSEYRRVSLSGHYLPAKNTLTKAVTERGPGFWLMTPFRDERGFTVLVNRGFVPEANARRAEEGEFAAPDTTRVTGLLRLSEPDGGFLRGNDPAAGRWYSRDVAAIAQARGLGEVAPYFVDADTDSEPGPLPRGGMTVIAFRNTHLVYALTWFALMAMSAWAWVFIWRGGQSGR